MTILPVSFYHIFSIKLSLPANHTCKCMRKFEDQRMPMSAHLYLSNACIVAERGIYSSNKCPNPLIKMEMKTDSQCKTKSM